MVNNKVENNSGVSLENNVNESSDTEEEEEEESEEEKGTALSSQCPSEAKPSETSIIEEAKVVKKSVEDEEEKRSLSETSESTDATETETETETLKRKLDKTDLSHEPLIKK